MYSIFKSNRPYSFILVLFIGFILWEVGLVTNQKGFVVNTYSMPLYDLTLRLIPSSLTIISVIAFLVMATGAYLTGYYAEKHELLKTPTFLTSFFYVILCCCRPSLVSLNPVLFANIFIVLGINRLVEAYRKDVAFSEIFDMAFLFSLASLYYLPVLFLLPVLFISLLILRPFLWREWFVVIMGAVIPYWILGAIYYYRGELALLTSKYNFSGYVLFSSFSTFTPDTWLMVALFVLLSVLSIFYFFSGNVGLKVKTRGALLVYFWLAVFVVLAVLLSGLYSPVAFSMLAIPLGVFLTNYFLSFKKKWVGEVLMWLIICTVLVNYF